MSNKPLRIITRSSPLALKQTDLFLKELSGYNTQIIPITSEGDNPSSRDLSKASFVTKLQQVIINDEGDIAVHSAKDMSCHNHPELTTAAYLPRAKANDVIVSDSHIGSLDQALTIATSSPRRVSQLNHFMPHLHTKPIRGNLQTRLNKLSSDPTCNALMLAYAGVVRLQWRSFIQHELPIKTFIPAPGQGAIAVECHNRHHSLIKRLQRINHTPTAMCIATEKAMARLLNASCGSPFGCHAQINGDTMSLSLYWEASPSQIFCDHLTLPLNQHAQLPSQMLKKLQNKGLSL